jgi:hypothetical protein
VSAPEADPVEFAAFSAHCVRDEIESIAKSYGDEKDPRVLLTLLIGLRGTPRMKGAVQLLAELCADIEDRLVAFMATNPDDRLWWRLELPGCPTIKRHAGPERKQWRGEELLEDLYRLAVEHPFDPESGERLEPVERLHQLVRECVRVSYGLVRPLRKLGVDPDEYCTKSPARQTIEIQ